MKSIFAAFAVPFLSCTLSTSAAQVAPARPTLEIRQTPTNAIAVTMTVQAGSYYLLQRALTVSGDWKSAAGLIHASNAVESFVLPMANRTMFYRAIAVSQIISLVETNSGDSLLVPTGAVLEIMLAANASTGYSWEIAPDSTAKVGLIDPVIYVAGSGIGASGQTIFRFEPLQTGQGQLRLIYHRSFDPPTTPPVKTFVLNLTVSPGI